MSRIIAFIRNLYRMILLYCLLGSIIASPVIDEALLNVARVKGVAVYTACIMTPPSTPAQAAACAALYAIYVASLQAVNAPFPLVVSTTPSPYLWSPYDVCRYEPTHFVFNVLVTQPFCPVL
ncbi:MAG: hypothetical protein K0R14_188 [Burkholderiales bacterium]|nr:hypothetical protein [Burkholderiales bacterium]